MKKKSQKTGDDSQRVSSSPYLFKKKNLWIYFWLGWVLVAVQARCDAQAPGREGFRSCCPWLSSCGSQALEHRLRTGAAWAYLLCAMWDLPSPGIEPASPALADRFPTTEPPGKHPPPLFSFKSNVQTYLGGSLFVIWLLFEGGKLHAFGAYWAPELT